MKNAYTKMKKTIWVVLFIIITTSSIIPVKAKSTESPIVNDILKKKKEMEDVTEAATKEMKSLTPSPSPIVTPSPSTVEEETEIKKEILEYRAERFKQRLNLTVKSLLLRYGPFYIAFAILGIILGSKKEKWEKLKKIGWSMIFLLMAGGLLMLFSSQIVNWLLNRFDNAKIRF